MDLNQCKSEHIESLSVLDDFRLTIPLMAVHAGTQFLFLFDFLLNVHGKQLRSCRGGQLS